jgi:molybdopterin adenylyltransferase
MSDYLGSNHLDHLPSAVGGELSLPHPDARQLPLNCAVITVSDTRTIDTDRSGELIQQLLRTAGHNISIYDIIADEPNQIRAKLDLTTNSHSPIQAIIFSGGTGISERDQTYEAISSLLTKTLPGFGEIFRWLSYQEIGSRAIGSRAIAGSYHNLLVFSLPGSVGAVKLGMEQLILPELIHLTTQLQ